MSVELKRVSASVELKRVSAELRKGVVKERMVKERMVMTSWMWILRQIQTKHLKLTLGASHEYEYNAQQEAGQGECVGACSK